jgi:hypothetical protein
MDELGPEARALLDAAREGLSPDPAAIRRVHGRIQAAASGAVAGTALAVKLGVVGLIAAVAIGAGVMLRRSPAPASPPSIELASLPEHAERSAVHEAAPPSDEALITIETPPPGATRPGDASPPRAHATAGAPTSAPGTTASGAASPARGATGVPAARTPSRTPIELGREVALIDLAMAALRRDDAAGALRTMQQYVAEAGDAGQLRQDAAAIEIEALCKLGDPAARHQRAAFDARFPHSAQRARLEAACR